MFIAEFIAEFSNEFAKLQSILNSAFKQCAKLEFMSCNAPSCNCGNARIITSHRMHVTNKQSLTFSKKIDAYNTAFAAKFATFLRAVPNNPIWGHLKYVYARIAGFTM